MSNTNIGTGSDNKSFFSGKKDQTSASSSAATSSTETSPVSQVMDSLTKGNSVLGKNIKFRGELIGTEDLHIEGTVEGTVIMEGHSLSIGEEGVINANVHAQNLTINGKLTGDVLADELIEIKNTAIVKGNLIAPRIQLDDGGKFRGSMDMTDTDQEKKEQLNTFKKKLVHPHLPARGEKSIKAETTNLNKDSSKSGFNKK